LSETGQCMRRRPLWSPAIVVATTFLQYMIGVDIVDDDDVV